MNDCAVIFEPDLLDGIFIIFINKCVKCTYDWNRAGAEAGEECRIRSRSRNRSRIRSKSRSRNRVKIRSTEQEQKLEQKQEKEQKLKHVQEQD